MIGQWIGRFTGTNTGSVHIDLEDVGDALIGHAYLYENHSMPAFLVPISLSKDKNKQQIEVSLRLVNPSNNLWMADLSEFSARFPGASIPTKARASFVVTGEEMRLAWETDIGTKGDATLHLSRPDRESELKSEPSVKNWRDFKDFIIGGLKTERFVFRGQGRPWRLRTSFHRTRRSDLVRLQSQDYQALHRAVSAQSLFPFDLTNVQRNAAFWHLVQHHGYPTPLLDWTYSPFIAAYFAFRTAPISATDKDFCRVFAFDGAAWRSDFEQYSVINPVGFHVSMLEPLAYVNMRALPQQSLSMVTNISDIEDHIGKIEKHTGKKYLAAFDMPAVDRGEALKELRLMGITASSLFPGLDGACEDLRERFFQ